MNIAILGKGTSSLITAIVCLLRGHQVSIYYDPDKEHISVGESTTPHFANILKSAFGISINDIVDKNLASFKTGIKFINWGKGNSFKHPFMNNALAFHFSTHELNPFVVNLLKERGVKFYPQRVDNYTYLDGKVILNELTYDFLISCVGWAEDNNYLKPMVETVNSGITYEESSLDIDSTYTIHRATKDGWQFGLPFPQKGVTRCGYLFDRNVTSTESVKKEISEKHVIHNVYEWQPRYCKYLIQDEFVAYNGNRLFFFEPLQALSLYYTYRFADLICNYLSDKSGVNKTVNNSRYLSEIYMYQQTISWHYRFGSKHKTEFWNNIVNKTNTFLNTTPTGDMDLYLNLLNEDKKYVDTNFSTIGIFTWKDMDYIVSGMTS